MSWIMLCLEFLSMWSWLNRVSTNLRDVESGRGKLGVLCCWRDQPEKEMVLEFFPHADCSVCFKLLFLAGATLDMRSLLLFSQLCTSLLLLFPSWGSPSQSPSAFSNTTLAPHFHFPFLCRPVCVLLQPVCVPTPILLWLVLLPLPCLLYLTVTGL